MADMLPRWHDPTMNQIISLAADNTAGLSKLGLKVLHALVDGRGVVIRELGIAPDSRVVHRHPGCPTVAKHGLFDLQQINIGHATSDMALEHFDRLWHGDE